jgi:hypothetical protein
MSSFSSWGRCPAYLKVLSGHLNWGARVGKFYFYFYDAISREENKTTVFSVTEGFLGWVCPVKVHDLLAFFSNRKKSI